MHQIICILLLIGLALCNHTNTLPHTIFPIRHRETTKKSMKQRDTHMERDTHGNTDTNIHTRV
jgi:hypothetical protein